MRVFDHHYTRCIVRKIRSEGGGDPNAGCRKETAVEWTASRFDPKSCKAERRKYFVG